MSRIVFSGKTKPQYDNDSDAQPNGTCHYYTELSTSSTSVWVMNDAETTLNTKANPNHKQTDRRATIQLFQRVRTSRGRDDVQNFPEMSQDHNPNDPNGDNPSHVLDQANLFDDTVTAKEC